MATFYTSDLHLGHRLVAGKRGFGEVIESVEYIAGEPVPVREVRVTPGDLERYHEALIGNWNSVVKDSDTVWVLGDVTLHSFLDVRHLAMRLNGHRNLLLGNHDGAHPMHRGAWKNLHLYAGIFDIVQTSWTVMLEGQQVMMSHFPYTGDRGEDRAKQFRLRDYGAPIIHGHTHLPEKLSRSEAGTLQIHVGLDAHDMKPVSEAWVMRMLRENTEMAA